MKIAIVGCGTTGPAAGLALAQSGHEVTLFERVHQPQPVGAGILLQPTGTTILHRLGLRDQVLRDGAPVYELVGQTTSGKTVMQLVYRQLAEGLCGFGVHRGILYNALLNAVRNHKQIQTTFGVTITRWQQKGDLTLLFDESNVEYGPFDLTVIANGARSQLRNQLPGKYKAKRYPWAALWTVVEDREKAFSGSLRQTYNDTRQMAGTLPTGTFPFNGKQTSTVSLFWSLPADGYGEWRRAGMKTWKEAALKLNPQLEPLLAQIHDLDQLTFAEYYDVDLQQPYHQGVVVIGDAAHAMSPQLGQGANLGFIDAWQLAQALHDIHLGDEKPLAAARDYALKQYAARRANQLRFYRYASRLLTPLFQGSHSWVARPRDKFFYPVSHLPLVQQQSLLSLAGIKTGLWRSARLRKSTATISRQPKKEQR